jgi:hypothetical protein
METNLGTLEGCILEGANAHMNQPLPLINSPGYEHRIITNLEETLIETSVGDLYEA